MATRKICDEDLALEHLRSWLQITNTRRVRKLALSRILAARPQPLAMCVCRRAGCEKPSGPDGSAHRSSEGQDIRC